MTVIIRPATETASWNCAVCRGLQFEVAMSPVKSVARMVPVTAMPAPVETCDGVSTSAAPIELRFYSLDEPVDERADEIG
jgi:hypothetical protein